MVQYEGHVTKDGELVIDMNGSRISLREFLNATRLNKRVRQTRPADRRSISERTIAVAK